MRIQFTVRVDLKAAGQMSKLGYNVPAGQSSEVSVECLSQHLDDKMGSLPKGVWLVALVCTLSTRQEWEAAIKLQNNDPRTWITNGKLFLAGHSWPSARRAIDSLLRAAEI